MGSLRSDWVPPKSVLILFLGKKPRLEMAYLFHLDKNRLSLYQRDNNPFLNGQVCHLWLGTALFPYRDFALPKNAVLHILPVCSAG